MERRIVAQMLTCMDDLAEQHSAAPVPEGAPLQNKHVVVIGRSLNFILATVTGNAVWDLAHGFRYILGRRQIPPSCCQCLVIDA